MSDGEVEAAETAVAPGTTACAHYARHCEVLAECCKQWVGCRLCHNERFEDHEIDRHAIRSMRCAYCRVEQPCARECSSCGRCMGEYFCRVCNLFDDGGVDKQFFHCDDCGICRVGGRENFYHCKKCCGCYPHSLESKHKCLEGSMHRECPICLDVTFESLESVNVLPCGHVMHASCFREYVRHRNIECPTCRTAMFSEDELTGGQGEGEDEDDGTDGEENEETDSDDDEMASDDEEGESDGSSDEDADDDHDHDHEHGHDHNQNHELVHEQEQEQQ